MTSFVHVDQPTDHPGVVRAERAASLIAAAVCGIGRSYSSATLLLAAMVSALLVVANQVIDTWTEGHLLAAWIVMWTVAFAALALLAVPAGRAAAGLRTAWSRSNAARKQAAEDQKLWEVALTDARLMADIGRAMASDARRDPRPYF